MSLEGEGRSEFDENEKLDDIVKEYRTYADDRIVDGDSLLSSYRVGHRINVLLNRIEAARKREEDAFVEKAGKVTYEILSAVHDAAVEKLSRENNVMKSALAPIMACDFVVGAMSKSQARQLIDAFRKAQSIMKENEK